MATEIVAFAKKPATEWSCDCGRTFTSKFAMLRHRKNFGHLLVGNICLHSSWWLFCAARYVCSFDFIIFTDEDEPDVLAGQNEAINPTTFSVVDNKHQRNDVSETSSSSLKNGKLDLNVSEPMWLHTVVFYFLASFSDKNMSRHSKRKISKFRYSKNKQTNKLIWVLIELQVTVVSKYELLLPSRKC